jgi:hypothetical protein
VLSKPGQGEILTHKIRGCSRLLTKLDARDRTHLVIAAYDAGLVDR